MKSFASREGPEAKGKLVEIEDHSKDARVIVSSE